MLARYVFSAAILLLPLPIKLPLPRKHGPEVLKPIKDVTVQDIQGAVGHMAADVKGQRLFLVVTGTNSIEVFDAQTLQHLNSIVGLSQPNDIVYQPEANRLLVTNGADGTLRTYDGSTYKLLDSKQMGGDAERVRVTPNGKTQIVGWGVGSLALLDVETGKRADVKLRSHPYGMQVDMGGNRIYVNLPGVGEVAVVDRRAQAVTESWSVRQHDNVGLALDDAGRRLFVACRRPARLLVMNMDDGAVMASFATVGDADDVFFDQQHKRVYVLGGEGQVAAYKQTGSDQYVAVSRTDTVEEARTGVFVPQWNRLFVAARNRPPGFPLELFSFGVLDEGEAQGTEKEKE